MRVSKNLILNSIVMKLLIALLLILFGMEPKLPHHSKDHVKIMIVYDNYRFTETTMADWGFACIVIRGNDTLMFDTGAQKEILFHNLQAMNLRLANVHKLVISHHHGDHTGNIFPVLEANPLMQVFLPSSLDGNFRKMVENYGARVVCDAKMRPVGSGMYLSGEMGFQTREQALVIRTARGLVLLTGCGHPGVDRMVKKVAKLFGEPVYLVMGGFHLEDFTDHELDNIIGELKKTGVKKVIPGHCTGSKAIERFAAEFGNDCLQGGTGRIIEI
ncbi:MBL fold metallo-hydrolase [Candidatus Falkowbacteria bacterium]|nr:MBL fold metallo-hydrolase [Candidatus Falkowbacteria bacterium]